MTDTSILDRLEAALFSERPEIGSTDCTHEISYRRYKRVPFIGYRLAADPERRLAGNATRIDFPQSDQEEPVFARYLVVMDDAGVIHGVHELDESTLAGPMQMRLE